VPVAIVAVQVIVRRFGGRLAQRVGMDAGPQRQPAPVLSSSDPSFSAPNECVKVMPDCGVASSKRMAPAAVGWASAKPAARQKTETNDAVLMII
jgi:hypothetical protein